MIADLVGAKTVAVGGAFAATTGVLALMITEESSAFLLGLAALVTAIGAVVVNIMTSIQASKKQTREAAEALAKQKEVSDKATAATVAEIREVSAKADVIEGHVNSAASTAAAEIAALRKEITSAASASAAEIAALHVTLTEAKETAKLLAQSVAVSQALATARQDGITLGSAQAAPLSPASTISLTPTPEATAATPASAEGAHEVTGEVTGTVTGTVASTKKDKP